MRALWLVLLLATLPAAADPRDEEAILALTECIAGFGDERSAMFKEISTQCAGLPEALQGSRYAQWLPERWWSNTLTLHALDDLLQVLEAEQAAPEAGPLKVEVAPLGPILDELREQQRQDAQSLFARVREWLRGHLWEQYENEDPSWIEGWLSRLERNKTAFEVFTWCVFIFVVGLALAIVFNELRAAGLLRRAASDASDRTGGRRVASGRPATLEDLDAVDPVQRPSFMLELVLGALGGAGRAGDRALTHRELRQRIQVAIPTLAPAFDVLARCAERVRYSPQLPPETEIDAAVQSGRDLLGSLARPAGARA